MMTAEQLLAGPRGRRLLLEVALACDRTRLDAPGPLFSAVFDASFRIEESRGHAVWRIGWGDLTPMATEGDVAIELARLELAQVTESGLFEALRGSVDAARYWQEADGDDLLCNVPVVREALAGVAGHVAAAPVPGWWSEPLDRQDQWELAWRDAHHERHGDLSSWRAEVLRSEEAARAERPTSVTANWSGEWWSRPPHWLTSSTRATPDGIPVGMRLVEDSLDWTEATVHRLEVPADAQVYEIDSPDAWARLCRDFPLEVTMQVRHDWYRTTGRDGDWVVPDWAAVADRYAGVHLTVAAYLEAATTSIPVTGRLSSVIAGFDPDTTWWFHGAVTRTGEPRSVLLPED